MSEALQRAVDNLNAAFDLNVRLPVTDVDILALADLAEQRGRNRVAECLRNALRLEAGVATQPACHCNICMDRVALVDR